MNVYKFWEDVLRQDAEAIRGYFRTDAVISWHCSNERFTVEEFIRANCEYPGDWDGEVERVVDCGGQLVTATHVYPKDRSASYHVVSFISLRDGLIAALDEYWGDDGPAPEWRQEMGIGTEIN